MRVIVRRADEHDVPAMGALLVEINDVHAGALPGVFARIAADGATEAFVRDRFGTDDGQAFVAEDAGAVEGEGGAGSAGDVVGFVWVRLHSAPPVPLFVPRRYAEVDTLVVADRARRQGVGRVLVERAHRWAADQGVTEVQVVVWDFNAAAIGLYEAFGYTTTRRTMRCSLGLREPGEDDSLIGS